MRGGQRRIVKCGPGYYAVECYSPYCGYWITQFWAETREECKEWMARH